MKKITSLMLVLLMAITAVFSESCAKKEKAAPGHENPSLVELVKSGESGLFSVSFERYNAGTKDLPIGVFDSGIGGLTVLEEILRLDKFDNVTREYGPDGRPDFENERFVYLGDQANMPYGNYPSENRVDFLRELILKDAVFLLGGRYRLSASMDTPRDDKPPVKAVVIACNTATAYGLEDIREAIKEWGLQVYLVGVVEAGAKGAVAALKAQGNGGTVAVLATVGTCRSEGYVRAVEKSAREAGITLPEVIQQGCLGLAGAIEGDASYISAPGAVGTVEYRGPAVGNAAAPVDTALTAVYGFEAEGLLGIPDSPETRQLNSVENYIRYHTAALTEQHRRSAVVKPVSAVILGCTHFPYFVDRIAASFSRLRDFRTPDGEEPYKNILAEKLTFIDPAELTAEQLYEALAGSGQLLDEDEESAVEVDEFYISVPNETLAGVELAPGGGFTYDYKYGRSPGNFTVEYVKRVPMSAENLSETVRNSVSESMPLVWERLIAFSNNSPRTKDLPEMARIK